METLVKLVSPGVHLSAADFIKKIFEIKVCPDVILKAWGQDYPAHRIVLSCQSEYFEKKFILYPDKMLKANVHKSDSGQGDGSSRSVTTALGQETETFFEINFGDDVTKDGFDFSLQYLYCGDGLSLTMENVFNVLNCAFFLQIQSLIDECFSFLMESLSSVDNFVPCYRWAQDHAHGTLSDDVLQACKNLMAICMPREVEKWLGLFCQLDPTFLRDVILSTTLAVQNEYERYSLAKRIIAEFDLAAQLLSSLYTKAQMELSGSESGGPSLNMDGEVDVRLKKQCLSASMQAEHVRQLLLSECIEYAYMSLDEIIQIREEDLVPEEAFGQSLWYLEYLRYALSKAENVPTLKLSALGVAYRHKLRHPCSMTWTIKVGDILASTREVPSQPSYYSGSTWHLKTTVNPYHVFIFRSVDARAGICIMKDTRDRVSAVICVDVWCRKRIGPGTAEKLKSYQSTFELFASSWNNLGEAFTRADLDKLDQEDTITFVATFNLSITT